MKPKQYTSQEYKQFRKESEEAIKQVKEELRKQDSLDVLVFPAYHSGKNCSMQMCIANRAENLEGIQAGIANIAGNGKGLQFGIANGAVNEFYGLQVGAVNVGSEYGIYLQIGLLNAKPGKDPLYKRISPVIGFKYRTKPKE